MFGLDKTAVRFLARYESDYPNKQREAELVRKLVISIISDQKAFVHVVSARAKSVRSLRDKLRRKKYKQPARDLTDLIGVRVISYYRDTVDEIVSELQKNLVINASQSIDKRLQLGLRGFGYRSVHLIARINSSVIRANEYEPLEGQWFEIQVRSILEHAWAEIEHEVVYKSGINYPEGFNRQFASLAGTLELLDSQFLSMRGQRDTLIDAYRKTYILKQEMHKSFDVARLLGFLEAIRPDGLSWRKAARDGKPFEEGLDRACVAALKAAHMSTPASLKAILSSARFRYAATTYAASIGSSPLAISHLAMVVIAIALRNGPKLRTHFPEIIFDSGIERIIVGRRSRR
jgi:ppGpp synthetase/RelA/SpoT-type nucleotidyltranferase